MSMWLSLQTCITYFHSQYLPVVWLVSIFHKICTNTYLCCFTILCPYYPQVSENGFISFGHPASFWQPRIFPLLSPAISNMYIVAAFWSDNDIRQNGSIFYQVHELGSDPTSISAVLLERVSSFIRIKKENTFSGQWMLVVQWEQVRPDPFGITDTELLNRVSQLYYKFVYKM